MNYEKDSAVYVASIGEQVKYATNHQKRTAIDTIGEGQKSYPSPIVYLCKCTDKEI